MYTIQWILTKRASGSTPGSALSGTSWVVVGCIALEGVWGAISLPVEQLWVWVGWPGAPIHKTEKDTVIWFDSYKNHDLQQVKVRLLGQSEKLKHVPADFCVCIALAGKMIIDDYFVSIEQLLITVPVVANTVVMS